MIRQYLLGQLAEQQQLAIEQRLLTEDGLFEELEAIEDELFDDYVADELTRDDRKQFEQYFLSTPARRQELEFAAGLHHYLAKKTVSEGANPSVSLPGGSGPIAWFGQTQLDRKSVV